MMMMIMMTMMIDHDDDDRYNNSLNLLNGVNVILLLEILSTSCNNIICSPAKVKSVKIHVKSHRNILKRYSIKTPR